MAGGGLASKGGGTRGPGAERAGGSLWEGGHGQSCESARRNAGELEELRSGGVRYESVG